MIVESKEKWRPDKIFNVLQFNDNHDEMFEFGCDVQGEEVFVGDIKLQKWDVVIRNENWEFSVLDVNDFEKNFV